jgi:hypothetical protein
MLHEKILLEIILPILKVMQFEILGAISTLTFILIYGYASCIVQVMSCIMQFKTCFYKTINPS